jgi:ligand-binding sensor domain-containing protein
MSKLKFCKFLFLSVVINLFCSCNNDDPVVDEEFVFPSKVINKIIVDSNGAKWFATEKGVVSYNGLKWTSYTDEGNKTTGSVSDIIFDRLSGIKKLWLGTNIGLSSYEFGTSTISTDNFNTSKDEILSDTVSALGVDKNAVKYIATSKGLSILKDNKWDKFYGRNGEKILAEFKISSVAVADNGYIYAATEGGGISRFKYTDAISGATTFNLPWSGGLPSENVLCAITDGNAQWYGTNAGVAYHASELAKSGWTTYTRADGLICDTVYSIAKDLSGNVWFGTHKGVSKLTGNQWQSITKTDGLLENKVNAIAIDKDNSVWIGTDKGISHFSGGKWENF